MILTTTLVDLHRRHIRTKHRSVDREVHLDLDDDIPGGTVKSRNFRALAELREVLDENP